ncbi:hypothetical protein VTL71DRAFT_15188 [Oculimacula yallundae]|uniref:Zn(2)-C6 fungal-type domain-containing protein n=1 Tax=Oculimacula yallundae TaxID=86028 RepID=A0ABR4CFV8_9HELO
MNASSASPEWHRRRAKRPKVKTGCVTCKIRRVKCDETRPHCLRCSKFGEGYCDGYEPTECDQIRKRPPLSNKSTSLARIQNSKPKRDPAIRAFKSQEESFCFRLYCEEVAPQLSSSNSSIWHHLLLQAGQNQPFIRHAIIAIGALNKSLRDPSTITVSDKRKAAMVIGGNYPMASEVREFALGHYDKFLEGAKAKMSLMSREEVRRTAMLVCLLVVCIENMQYRSSNALEHAQNGLRLLNDLRSDTIDDKQLTGMSSPIPNVIEDEIVQQFHRMELQVMATYDARISSEHTRLKNEGSASVKDMPEMFTSLEQARLFLHLVMRRTFHFMGYALTHQSAILNFSESVRTSNDGNALGNKSSSLRDGEAPEELQVEQEMYAAENRRWALAFEPMLRNALRTIDRVESIPFLLLKVQSLAMNIRLAAPLSTSELVYDRFLPEFKQIVSLSGVILKHRHVDKFFAAGAFSFDMGLLWAIMTPAMSCRDRILRREAISLLCIRPWREAQWHSHTSADIATFLMDTEEEGVETAYIPEWARARLSGIVANQENISLHIHCIRGFGENATHRDSLRHYFRSG